MVLKIMNLEKHEYWFSKDLLEFDELVRLFGNVETIEAMFGIEFACHIDEQLNAVFPSDGEVADQFDGEVIPVMFRLPNKKVVNVYGANSNVRFTVNVDETARGLEQFRNCKVKVFKD